MSDVALDIAYLYCVNRRVESSVVVVLITLVIVMQFDVKHHGLKIA